APPAPQVATSSLHDALPISTVAGDIQAIVRGRHGNPFGILGMHGGGEEPLRVNVFAPAAARVWLLAKPDEREVCELERIHPEGRSEEHTSELQSRENLVCRL